MDLCENQKPPREALTVHYQITGNKDPLFMAKLRLNVNAKEVTNALNR